MPRTSVVDPFCPALLERLAGVLDLEASAKASGALRRRRAVSDAATLLRLALAHGPGGLSLRSAAAWAGVSGVAQLSDVALRKRLRGAGDWLGQIAGALLGGRGAPRCAPAGRRLRLVDSSSFSHPGAPGTAWRLHAAYDPGACCFSDLHLTGGEVSEGFACLRLGAGEVVVADRGYARPRGLGGVLAAGADFIVRVSWQSLSIVTPDGEPLRWEELFASLAPGQVAERRVLVTPQSKGAGRRRRSPLFGARLVVLRHRDPATRDRAERRVRRQHSKRCARGRVLPLTLASTDYLMVLTSLPQDAANADTILAAYRLRWQIELAFKRLKSGLGMHRLQARDGAAARSWLLAHLILALLVEDAATDVLDSAPLQQPSWRGRVSVWRLHVALRHALLGAALPAIMPAALARCAGVIVRHICDPPRRRPLQSARALLHAA